MTDSTRAPLRIGIPDLVSNSYFPIIAAVELGFLRDEGIDAEIELLFPVTDAAHALREGRLDMLGGAAHAPLYAYPGWKGVRLLAALSQNTYWFLVVRAELGIEKGDLSRLRDIRVGAAPGVGDGLVQLLLRSGIDLETAGITIAPVPGTGASSVSFGVTAAEALSEGRIDAFWANGMGAEVAVVRGVGTVVVDARRDGSPGSDLTFPALATSEELLRRSPEVASGAVRALVRAQKALRADPEIATGIGERLFPHAEAALIAELVRRDVPFYDPVITPAKIESLGDFARSIGLDPGAAEYSDVVATELSSLWGRGGSAAP